MRVSREVTLAISHRIVQRYATKNEEIVAGLRELAGAAAPLDPMIVIKRKAAEISTAMALLHGGDWRIEIDHQARFVLVAPRLASG